MFGEIPRDAAGGHDAKVEATEAERLDGGKVFFQGDVTVEHAVYVPAVGEAATTVDRTVLANLEKSRRVHFVVHDVGGATVAVILHLPDKKIAKRSPSRPYVLNVADVGGGKRKENG